MGFADVEKCPKRSETLDFPFILGWQKYIYDILVGETGNPGMGGGSPFDDSSVCLCVWSLSVCIWKRCCWATSWSQGRRKIGKRFPKKSRFLMFVKKKTIHFGSPISNSSSQLSPRLLLLKTYFSVPTKRWQAFVFNYFSLYIIFWAAISGGGNFTANRHIIREEEGGTVRWRLIYGCEEERRGEKGGGPALRNCKHTGWRTRAQSSFGVGLGYPTFL